MAKTNEFVFTSSITELNAKQWLAHGPQTPAQVFFKAYGDCVDSKGFYEGTGLKFYSTKLVYHNQNQATYYGGEQMWTWMQELFKPFERMEHDFLLMREISRSDGTVTLDGRFMRKIRMKGNTTAKPDVEIPMWWDATIGPADSPEGLNGLQMKEVWLFWDTALLAPFMAKDAVAFRTQTPMVS